MPIYYNPGSCFTKISHYHSSQSAIGIKACTQGDYWSAAEGSIVPAAADGIVYIAEKSNTINNNYGYYVVLEHTKKEKLNGKEIKVYTIYAHLNPTFLVKGHQKVTRGQALGYVGNSGGTGNVKDAKGLYFHFEIRDANYWIAPGKTWRDIDVVDPATFDLAQLMGIDETDQNTYSSPSCKADTSTADSNPEEENAPAIEPSSTVTACTEEEFIVQVMGKDHPAGQRIVVLDEKENEIPLTKKDVIGKTDQILLSTLHKWDWCKLADKKIKICLEITANNGNILIPLSTHKQQTPLREDKQLNQIVPIVPCTQIKAQSHSASNFNYPALARKGYFYIFKENKPWRELEISTDAKGNPSYRDVDIKNPQYYDANEELFKLVARKATGTALKEIWVPSCFYDKPETYDFFYSEVQLSAARLNLFIHQQEYFQRVYPKSTYCLIQTVANQKKENTKDASQVKQMITNSIKSRTTQNIRFSDAITFSHRPGQTPTFPQEYFQAKALPPMRNRDETVELLLNHPAAYLYDSENNYFSDCVALAKKFKEAAEKGEDFDDIYKLEINALQYIYEQSLKKENALQYVTRMCGNSNQTLSEYMLGISNKSLLTVNPQNTVIPNGDDEELAETQPDVAKAVTDEQIAMCTIADVLSGLKDNAPQIFDLKNTQSIWGNPKSIAFNNALQDAQDREIYCVVVEDQHFSLRQNVLGINLTQQAFGKMVEVISKRPFFDSAVLIHKMVATTSFGENENPLSKQFKSLDKKEGGKKLAIAGGSFERTVLLNHYEALQKQVITQLNNFSQKCVLADHLSQLSEVHYATAYAFLVMSLATLLMNTFDLDPLLSPDGLISRDHKSPPYFYAGDQMAGYAFIASIINTPSSNLHRMLYTPLDRKDIAKPKNQHTSSHNLGLGWVRPDILNLALNKKHISEDEQTNFDTAAAAASQSGTRAASGKDTALLEIKGLQQIVSGACEVLNNIAVTAFKKIQESKTELVDLTEAYDKSLAEIKRLNDEYEGTRQKIKNTEQDISHDETALDEHQQKSQQQQVALDNEATKQASYDEQITKDKVGVFKAETEIYFSKQWLREVNINDIMGSSVEAYKAGSPIKIGRIRLFQDKGAGMAFEAINFHHTRAVLRGKTYTVYVAPFIHNTKAGEVRGVLLKIPLEGLSNTERDKLYSRQTSKLRGTVPDENGGIKASTRSQYVNPLDRNPHYELAFFYPEGSAEFDELTKEVTPEQSSLSPADELAAAQEIRRARIAENERALRNEQTQLSTADKKARLESQRAQKQQQYNQLTNEIGLKQESGQKVDPELIGEHSRLKTELAKIDAELITLNTNNPAERIEAAAAYKEMLLADKELQEKLLAQSQEESARLAGEQQQTHKEIALLKTKVDQAKQKLSQLMAKREIQGNLSADETERFNKYRSEIQRLEQNIAENTQSRTKAIENRLYKVANTGMFKGFIIGWQLYNLKVAIETYSKSQSTSTFIGMGASLGEVSLAIADYLAFISQSAARETGMYKVVTTISPDKIPAFFKTSTFFTLETVVRVTALAQAAVGVLWTAKAVWEIYETWNRRESTGIRVARYLTLTSAVLTMIAPFFAGSTFLLLSPLMLAGIVIGIIAAGLMYYFQTTELEEWLKNGPFSAPNPGYSYLQQDPIEAYYRLVSALSPITIKLDHTPLRGIKKPQNIYQHPFINVTSYMANMIPADNNYFVEAAYVRKGWGVNRVSPCKLSKHTTNIEGGKRYRALTLYPITKHSHHNLIVKAQIWVEYRGNTLRFPAPPIVEDDKLNYTTYKAYPSSFLVSEEYWKDNIDNPFSEEIRI